MIIQIADHDQYIKNGDNLLQINVCFRKTEK